MHKGEPGLPQGHSGPGPQAVLGCFSELHGNAGIPGGAYGQRGVIGVPGQPWKFSWLLRGR